MSNTLWLCSNPNMNAAAAIPNTSNTSRPNKEPNFKPLTAYESDPDLVKDTPKYPPIKGLIGNAMK
jgi:hypothetical protein